MIKYVVLRLLVRTGRALAKLISVLVVMPLLALGVAFVLHVFGVIDHPIILGKRAWAWLMDAPWPLIIGVVIAICGMFVFIDGTDTGRTRS